MAAPALAVKAAALAVKNKDKIGKILLTAVLVLLTLFILLAVCFFSLIRAFLPEGLISSTGTFPIEETAIYQAVSGINKEFYDSIKKQMEEEKKKLVERNTTQETKTDESGNEMTVNKCNITITMTLNYSGSGYLIAYLMYADGLDFESTKVNEDKAKKFLNSISSLKTEKIASDKYGIENVFLPMDKIAEKYFPNDKTMQSRFKASCSAYAGFFQTEAEVKTETIDIHEILNTNVNLLEIPLYLQYQGPWSGVPFGGGTIASSGCSVTCLAMVLSFLKQEVILPNHIVEFTGNRYYVPPAGQSWGIFPAVADHWGITCTNLGLSEQNMVQALSDGKPVIASMKPGTFTRGGHFIVLSGITENGKIKVNDPNDSATKNFKEREFEVSLILRESKNFWSFE